MISLVGVGVPTADDVYRVGPETLRTGGLIEHLASDGGGQVATALVAAARLGARTALLGTVGPDERGATIRRDLAAAHVEVSGLHVAAAGRSAGALVFVDPAGERHILYEPATVPVRQLTPADRDAVAAADGLLLERDDPLSVACADAARAGSVPVLLDLDAYLGDPARLAVRPTIVIASAAAAADRGVDETLRYLIAGGAEVAIVTLGAAGARARTAAGEVLTVPAEPVQVVDTTGAGDAYHGAFLVAWCDGAGLAAAMEFAARVAALNCTGTGGRAGLPTRSELTARYGASRYGAGSKRRGQ